MTEVFESPMFDLGENGCAESSFPKSRDTLYYCGSTGLLALCHWFSLDPVRTGKWLHRESPRSEGMRCSLEYKALSPPAHRR